MKLLKKSVVAKEQAHQRKVQIDEGIKLAQRVDSLRRTRSEEEQNLEKFRENSLKIVKDEIDFFLKEKEALKGDIDFLGKQKKELLKMTLDVEWKDIDDKNLYLDEAKELLRVRLSSLEQKERDIDSKLRELSDERNMLEREKEAISSDRQEANELTKKAQQKLASASVREKTVLENLEKKTRELLSREGNIASQERTIQLKEVQFAEERIELDNRKKQIDDQYETLLRTIKRINQQ